MPRCFHHEPEPPISTRKTWGFHFDSSESLVKWCSNFSMCFFNWDLKQPQPPTERYFPCWPQRRGEEWMCHVPGSSNFIGTGVEFSDGLGLPPILENTHKLQKDWGEDKLVNDFLKIQDPPKTSMETGNGPLQKEIPYLETIIFRFHVSFGGSMYFMTLFHAFHAPMLTCEADQIQRFHAKKPTFSAQKVWKATPMMLQL